MDFRLFDAVKSLLPAAVGLLSSSHDQVLKAAQAAIPPEEEKLDLIIRVEKLGLADFSSLDWHEIFELRQSGFVEDFRARLSEIASSQSSSRRLESHLLTSLWSLVADVEPNLKRTYATAVIGNLPLPIPLNPVGVLSSMKDIKHNRDLNERYGWLFFIAEAQESLARKPVSTS